MQYNDPWQVVEGIKMAAAGWLKMGPGAKDEAASEQANEANESAALAAPQPKAENRKASSEERRADEKLKDLQEDVGGEDTFSGHELVRIPDDPKSTTLPTKSYIIEPRSANFGDMDLTDFAPGIFNNIKKLSGTTARKYIKSWTFDSEHQIPMPDKGAGRSGSLFMFSADRRFLLKSIPDHEVQTLVAILHDYRQHLRDHPDSRLMRFLALHRFHCASTRTTFHVLVANNILHVPRGLTIHHKFDLKGRTPKRDLHDAKYRNPAKGEIWKDNQLSREFHTDPSKRDGLLQILRTDVEFLRSHNMMDYSVLIGVHDVHRSEMKQLQRKATMEANAMYESIANGDAGAFDAIVQSTRPDEVGKLNNSVVQGAACPPLHMALDMKNVPFALSLLSKGADVHASDDQGEIALHRCAVLGEPAILECLLNRDPKDVSLQLRSVNKRGETPLHLAAASGQLPTVELLVAHGANIHAVDKDGATPLFRAADNEHFGIVAYLSRHSGDKGQEQPAAPVEPHLVTRTDTSRSRRIIKARRHSRDELERRAHIQGGVLEGEIVPFAEGEEARDVKPSEHHMKQNQMLREEFGGRVDMVATPAAAHEEIFFVGIIDFLSRYGLKKKTANFFKSFLWKPEMLSTVPADFYAKRFLNYVDSIFPECRCKPQYDDSGKCDAHVNGGRGPYGFRADAAFDTPFEKTRRLEEQQRNGGSSSGGVSSELSADAAFATPQRDPRYLGKELSVSARQEIRQKQRSISQGLAAAAELARESTEASFDAGPVAGAQPEDEEKEDVSLLDVVPTDRKTSAATFV